MKFIPRALVTTALLSFVALSVGASTDHTLEEIAPYRQWNRITLQAIVIDSSAFGGG